MSEWILCEDMLPDKTDDYLVTQYNVVYILTYVVGTGWITESKGDKVVAWMPLPEPYGGNITVSSF